jgi:hypothetical protein
LQVVHSLLHYYRHCTTAITLIRLSRFFLSASKAERWEAMGLVVAFKKGFKIDKISPAYRC